VRDDHAGQRLEQLLDDVALACSGKTLETLSYEFAHGWLDRLDLSGREPSRHEASKLCVGGRILHDHRRIVCHAGLLELVVVDGQPVGRRERLEVSRRLVHLRMASEDPVVVLR
jgi:hypothetical protein